MSHSSPLIGEYKCLELSINIRQQLRVIDILALFNYDSLFGHFLFIQIDLGLDNIEVDREFLKDEGRTNSINLNHEGQGHDIEHIPFVKFAVLKHVREEVVFGADLPMMLEMVDHLFLI